jgi:hypothetical protein
MSTSSWAIIHGAEHHGHLSSTPRQSGPQPLWTASSSVPAWSSSRPCVRYFRLCALIWMPKRPVHPKSTGAACVEARERKDGSCIGPARPTKSARRADVTATLGRRTLPGMAESDDGKDAPPPIMIEVNDTVRISKSLGIRASGQSGETAVRVTDSKGQSLAVDLRDDGSLEVRIRGQAYPGWADEHEACDLLRRRLQARGEDWGPPEPWCGPEAGIDRVLRRGNEKLPVQVTRSVRDEPMWRELAEKGEAVKRFASADAAAGAIYEAIKAKADRTVEKDRSEIVLVLNGSQVPIGLDVVKVAFETRHGSWARSLGYRAIWVVEAFGDETWTFPLVDSPL